MATTMSEEVATAMSEEVATPGYWTRSENICHPQDIMEHQLSTEELTAKIRSLYEEKKKQEQVVLKLKTRIKKYEEILRHEEQMCDSKRTLRHNVHVLR